MTATNDLAADLAAIHDLADATQLERLAAAAGQLYEVRSLDHALVAAALGVFERCGAQEDFGVFHTLQCYLERFTDDPSVRAVFRESVRLRPAWKTIAMLPGFVGLEPAIEILEEVVREGRFVDRRHDADWLAEHVEDLRDELE